MLDKALTLPAYSPPTAVTQMVAASCPIPQSSLAIILEESTKQTNN